MIFQYAHLLKGSIRLVRFHPDSTPASISLTLEHEARYHDRNVHYAALAYGSQGSNGDMSEIVLQGRTRRVPWTLWQALSALVEHHDTRGRFWIDYVCVNQNNESEKLDHHNRLPSIYAAADEVLLWLGTEHTVAGAEREMGMTGNDTHPAETNVTSEISKQDLIPRSTLERFHLQQARKVVLLRGDTLAEVRSSDPHSAL